MQDANCVSEKKTPRAAIWHHFCAFGVAKPGGGEQLIRLHWSLQTFGNRQPSLHRIAIRQPASSPEQIASRRARNAEQRHPTLTTETYKCPKSGALRRLPHDRMPSSTLLSHLL